ncbi:MAG: ATP-binding protein [Chloroflexota bacterium]|nr:ATP-binding protein [Chloroflexota bacterium]
MDWLRRVSLRSKVVALVAASMAVLVSAFAFMAVDALHKDTERSLGQRLLLAQLLADRVSGVIREQTGGIERLARQFPVASPPGPDEGAALVEAVSHQLSSAPAYVLLLDRSGRVVASAPGDFSLRQVPLADVPVVEGAFANAQSGVSDVVPGLDGRKQVFHVASPAYDSSGLVSGVVLAALDPTHVTLGLPGEVAGSNALIEVVDSHGIVVGSNVQGNVLDLGDPGRHLEKLIGLGLGTVGTCHGCHGGSGSSSARQPQVLAFAPVENAPWGVAFLEPEQDVFASARQLRNRIFLTGGLSLLLVGVVSWLGVQRVVVHLEELTEASQRISRGDLDTEFPIVGESEVRTLSGALENMRQSLKAAQEEILLRRNEVQEVVELRERELAAMLTASETLAKAEDYAGLLQTVVQTAVDASPAAEAGVLFMYDETEGSLVARAAVGYNLDDLSRVRLHPGEGVAGVVFQTEANLVCNSASEVEVLLRDARRENYQRLLAARGGLPPQCLVAVPLRSRGQVQGSLVLVGLRQQAAFSPSEVRVVAAFASYASVVIEISRLLRETGQMAALKEADRLKSEFLSNVSHELRTPLTSIRISIESLLAAVSEGPGDPQIRLMRNIQRNVDRLAALVSELLDMARLQSGRMELRREQMDLREVVRESVETIRPLAEGKDIRLEVQLPARRLPALVDKGRLGQALLNLLTNATEYTPPHGAITVVARSHDGRLLMSVEDTGPGIPADEQDKIFERFYRGAASSGQRRAGMGLGLPIAKALVELHGGALWVESSEGKGATFLISLPLRSDVA